MYEHEEGKPDQRWKYENGSLIDGVAINLEIVEVRSYK